MSAAVPALPFEADPLIAEANQRARRRRFVALVAAGLIAAGIGLAVRAAVSGGPGSVVHRYAGPVDATATGAIASTGAHIGLSSLGTSGGVTWATNSYYNPRAFWLTNNGGESWHRLRLPDHAYAVNPRASIHDIQFVDRQHGWLSLGYRAYQTTDGGRTWQRSASGPSCLAPLCGVGAISSGGLPLRPVDNGRTYRLLRRPRSVQRMTSLNGGDGFMSVQGPGYMGPYDGPPVGGLYRTTDGGGTWSEYDIAGSNSAIELPVGVFGRRVIVVQNGPNPQGGLNQLPGTVWSSADDGSHWDGAAVPSQIGLPTSFSLASPRFWVFAAGGGNDLYVTADAGHSWRRIVLRGISRPLHGETGTAIASVAFSSPREGWAIVARLRGVSGVQTLIRTTDGGLHWTVNGPLKPKAQKHA